MLQRSRSFVSAAALAAALALAFGDAHAEIDIRRDATVAAIETVMPCVVNIATETVIEHHDFYDALLREFYGVAPRQEKRTSLGSGVIIDEEGYLLTNFHVVSRASRVQVKLWDGREYDAEPLIATPGSDVALLRIRGKPGEKFKAIRFAKDDDLMLGETVLALGNPFGLGGSVTRGILSSKNRRPTTGKEPLNVEDWLQTDASINPGNSGGPLVNLKGELIGLNVAVYREEQGMGLGFSIPVRQVSAALSRFFTPEWTFSLWFGAQFQNRAPLVVSSVQPGSPAARAGLREDDQVLQVDAQPASNLISVNRALGESKNQEAKMLIRRGSDRLSITVKLLPLTEIARQKLGLTFRELTAKNIQELGLPADQGLYVEKVEKGSPAETAGFASGFIVSAIEGEPTNDLRSMAGVLWTHKPGTKTQLTVVVPRRLGGNFVQYRKGTVELTVR